MVDLYNFEGKDYDEKLQNILDSDIENIIIDGIEFEIILVKKWEEWNIILYVYPKEEYNKYYSGGNIMMIIEDNVRKAGHIQRSKNVNGKRLLEVMDTFCIWLGLNSCFLSDLTTIMCKNVNPESYGMIDLKNILLLSDCQTYYEKNKFVQVAKFNKELWMKFLEIRATKLDDLFSSGKLTILKSAGYDKSMTLGEMFKDVKNRDCDFQAEILDICGITSDHVGCNNNFENWTYDPDED